MSKLGKVALAALAASALMTGVAQAGVLVFDDFESYGPTSQLNFTGFDDLTVDGGTVDYVHEPEYGLSTPTGTGMVDLDGSTGNGGELNTAYFAFNAGDTLTFEFDASGNQRGYPADGGIFGLRFSGSPTVGDVFATFGGATAGPLGPFVNSPGFFFALNRASGDAWGHWGVSFTALTSGTVSGFIQTTSADNVGQLVDNVSLTTTAVPEPATWLSMILGFGLLGATLRRRRVAFA